MYGRYFVLFAILFTGWFLRKINFIDDKMDHSINKLVVYFAYPCLIVHNIGELDLTADVLAERQIQHLRMLAQMPQILSLVVFYLYGFFCKGYARLRKYPKNVSGIAEFAMSMPNNGFMGFPVALIFFGDSGLLLMLAHNAAMNFFIFTYGVKLLRDMKTDDHPPMTPKRFITAVVKLLLNPNILALFIGFAFSMLGNGVPGVLDEYLLYIGNVSTPMAMIFIGSTLTNYKFRDIIRSVVTIEGSAVKLLLLPLLTLAAVAFLPIDPLIRSILVLGISFPTAATVPMLAEQEGLDAGVASKILFLSTVASIGTVPLLIHIIQLVIM